MARVRMCEECLTLLIPIREIGSVYPTSDYCGKITLEPYTKTEIGMALELYDVY
jgi:hypothetical protein